jgi:two-component system, response regulator RegA
MPLESSSTHRGPVPGGASVPPRSEPDPAAAPARPVLLVESSPAARGFLHRVLTAGGFAVLGVAAMRLAEQVAARSAFGHAVVNMRVGGGDGLALVATLRRTAPDMRIVVVTDVDSFATVILALRAGADDYLATPVDEGQLIAALLGRTPALPPVPETPLGVDRARWEHVMRLYEQCDRNVTQTAQRLGMHRRSLQRFLGKRAPPARAPVTPDRDRLVTGRAVSLRLAGTRHD